MSRRETLAMIARCAQGQLATEPPVESEGERLTRLASEIIAAFARAEVTRKAMRELCSELRNGLPRKP